MHRLIVVNEIYVVTKFSRTNDFNIFIKSVPLLFSSLRWFRGQQLRLSRHTSWTDCILLAFRLGDEQRRLHFAWTNFQAVPIKILDIMMSSCPWLSLAFYHSL